MNTITRYLVQLKPMRFVLLMFAVLTLVLRPMADADVVYSGWPMVTTLLVPVLVPLFFMLILLDALMAAVWKSESVEQEKQRYTFILRLNLSTAVILLLVWLPYYIALGR